MKNKHETKLKDISTKGFSRSNFIAVFIDEIVNGIVIFLGALFNWTCLFAYVVK